MIIYEPLPFRNDEVTAPLKVYSLENASRSSSAFRNDEVTAPLKVEVGGGTDGVDVLSVTMKLRPH